MLAVLLVAVLASSVSATCPDVKVVSPFNATKYLGLWYEIAASPLIKNTFEVGQKPICSWLNLFLMQLLD